MNKRLSEKGRIVNTCYDHVGGLLGEALLKFFLKEDLLKRMNEEFIITEKGWDELEIIGIDIEKLRSIKRKIVNVCIESNHGILYEHIGSYLGSILMEKMFELGWLKKRDDKRFELTEKGRVGLENFGVNINTLL